MSAQHHSHFTFTFTFTFKYLVNTKKANSQTTCVRVLTEHQPISTCCWLLTNQCQEEQSAIALRVQ